MTPSQALALELPPPHAAASVAVLAPRVVAAAR